MIAVGAYVRQCIWKPTVRRGRAICEFGRPSYKPLPPIVGAKVFDSTKRTAPAYSFGRKTGSRRTGFDDGPAKFDVSGMSNRGFYKKVGIAMKSRRVELKPFPNPGVGNYVVDRGFAVTTKTIPRYSFGKKPQQLKPFMTPAPNVYNLPPVVGTAKEGNKKAAPAFTMLGREKPRKLTCFIYPGPGDYEDKSVCKRKCPPKYTMRPQTKVLDDSINKPSPNAHYAELYHKHKSVPAPSFSIHHSPCLGIRKAYPMPDRKNLIKCNMLE
ncbi:ciliary microtubule associated protein 1B-like [Glossina fuscipes fuscipes]